MCIHRLFSIHCQNCHKIKFTKTEPSEKRLSNGKFVFPKQRRSRGKLKKKVRLRTNLLLSIQQLIYQHRYIFGKLKMKTE